MLRVRPRFSTDVPGPMIVLRPALPNVPGAGSENAAVLKNFSDVGSLSWIGCAVVVRAQRAVDAAWQRRGSLPSTRAVNGVPDASCTLPFTCQLPRSGRHQRRCR